MADDPSLVIAVRDKSLNVYYRGQSLARVFVQTGRVMAEVHLKYLVDPATQRYATVDEAGRIRDQNDHREIVIPTIGSFSDVRRLKAAASLYAGLEKEGVHELVRANTSVIDVEIAVSVPSKDGRTVARRIDLALIAEGQDGPVLRFVEAKHFSNTELRARGHVIPAVQQVVDYAAALRRHEAQVRASYQRVAENVLSLEGAAFASRRSDALLAAKHGITVDPEPSLIVYGFDRDQRDGAVWRGHRARLEQALGTPQRLILVGSPRRFRFDNELSAAVAEAVVE